MKTPQIPTPKLTKRLKKATNSKYFHRRIMGVMKTTFEIKYVMPLLDKKRLLGQHFCSRVMLFLTHTVYIHIYRNYICKCFFLCPGGEIFKLLSGITSEQLLECWVALATQVDILQLLLYYLDLRPLNLLRK